MPRRVNLPAADDLFRRTGEEPPKVRAVPDAPDTEPDPAPAAKRGPSGRVKHDEKMTVYVTSDELLEIEHARLALRSGPGLAVDRGRLVRVAISLALADFEANGEASELVRRLTEE
ncbi:MAG TPA: hypothetical protein VFO49_21260 [Nocardioides sp.]|nr:hypothetical protein [Nocardioides sp.]